MHRKSHKVSLKVSLGTNQQFVVSQDWMQFGDQSSGFVGWTWKAIIHDTGLKESPFNHNLHMRFTISQRRCLTNTQPKISTALRKPAQEFPQEVAVPVRLVLPITFLRGPPNTTWKDFYKPLDHPAFPHSSFAPPTVQMKIKSCCTLYL